MWAKEGSRIDVDVPSPMSLSFGQSLPGWAFREKFETFDASNEAKLTQTCAIFRRASYLVNIIEVLSRYG